MKFLHTARDVQKCVNVALGPWPVTMCEAVSVTSAGPELTVILTSMNARHLTYAGMSTRSAQIHVVRTRVHVGTDSPWQRTVLALVRNEGVTRC